ncbi:MAG TPA: LysR family transcriptional regulator, partial [Methylomirabilota bacterium]
MTLNPIHLRTLHEIARLQSFSRAAEALHLSQPAV